MPNHFKAGFTLVELSIVLVILGLLAGGVLSGRSLIRAAELRAVATEYTRYVTASQSFRDKYFAIPGDMTNATQFWGRMNGNADCVTNSSAAVSATGACDGNGDGNLDAPVAAAESGNATQFWRQLARAGLIEGSYSGLAGTAGRYHCVVGTDCPKGKMSNSGWYMYYLGNFVGDGQAYALDYGNALVFGATSTNAPAQNPALKPEEAWNIDTKLDDGKPAFGKVVARYWNGACAAADDGSNANNDLVASYRLTDSSAQCALYFRQAS